MLAKRQYDTLGSTMRIARHLASINSLAQANMDSMQYNTEAAAALKTDQAETLLELIDELTLLELIDELTYLPRVVLHEVQALPA